MIKITTLENLPLSTLATTFNEAFSDYIISVNITQEQLAEKIHSSNIQLDLSPGAFVDGKLMGFIWHGVGSREGKPMVWNGGTGVIPTQRGQGITAQLYDYMLPKLKMQGYEQTVLEVIIGNDPAVHTYLKTGFKIVRTLDCFRGRVRNPTEDSISGIAQRILKKPLDRTKLHPLCSWRPSFQNDDERIQRMGELVKGVGLYAGEKLIAYILFDARWDYGDVYQFAVHQDFRRRGLGKLLFSIAQREKTVPLKVINVDTRHRASIAFFEALGFERIIGQFEMMRKI